MSAKRIAIADDDKAAREYLEEVLVPVGYKCQSFSNGRDLISRLKRETFDLLVLDWNMPGMTAIEVMDWAKRTLDELPRIIVLTSRSDEQDLTFALDAGADDFITKPGSPEVIRARIGAALRRLDGTARSGRLEERGRYRFDRLEQTVSFDEHKVKLTSKEFALALFFLDNMQRPLSRGYIMQRIWGDTTDLTTRTLDMHVSKIRNKLKLRPEHGLRLQTIFGFGYRLDVYNENDVITE